MPVIDEIKEQQKKVKEQSFKKRLAYFWHYYRIHVFITLIVIIFISVFLRDVMINSREEVLNVLFINNPVAFDADILEQDFATAIELDTKEFQIAIDNSMTYELDVINDTNTATQIQLMGMTQSNDLDIIITDQTTFEHFADQGYFLDLQSFLSDELKEQISNEFYEYSLQTEDSTNGTKVSAMVINNHMLYQDTVIEEPMVLAVMINTEHETNIQRFIPFFLNYEFLKTE